MGLIDMPNFPDRVHICEEGPREGFQIEPGSISTAAKIRLIDALSKTGVEHIQTMSFVDPRRVPGMADATEVLRGIKVKPGIEYSALWFNERGLRQALDIGFLSIEGKITLYPSETFLKNNLGRTPEEHRRKLGDLLRKYGAEGIPVRRVSISSAFGCNFQGETPVDVVVRLVGEALEIADEHDLRIETVGLTDTMAWGTPESIKRAVGAVREKYPDMTLSLHLHDTRGMGIANAYAGLQMGVAHFDGSVAGLGGCPFAKHRGAAGNVCTEDLVFLCHELGIETGIDLDALIEASLIAEEVVGHALPGKVAKGGNLAALRSKSGTAH
jgi:hydroxymethylglutaryl-CoA lyase